MHCGRLAFTPSPPVNSELNKLWDQFFKLMERLPGGPDPSTEYDFVFMLPPEIQLTWLRSRMTTLELRLNGDLSGRGARDTVPEASSLESSRHTVPRTSPLGSAGSGYERPGNFPDSSSSRRQEVRTLAKSMNVIK